MLLGALWGHGEPARAQDDAQTTQVSKQDASRDWTMDCADRASGAETDCQVSQVMTIRETGQRILMVVVKKDRATDAPHVMLALPHKIFLPAGVVVRIDGRKPREMTIETCDERACYSSARVPADFLSEMQGGNAMHVTFRNLLRKPVTLSVPLRGFTVAYSRLN